jgi:hypothetical protein
MNQHSIVIYMLTTINKRSLISESRGDSNRCTPCRGNLIDMTQMLIALVHIHHTYAFCGQSPYVATIHTDPTELDRFATPEKNCSQLHLTQLSGPRDPPQFLYEHNHWSSALKPNICWWTGYIDLLGSYHQHVISTFNTCSHRPTHRSLTDTGGGYNLRGADFPHHTPWPSRPMVLCSPPKGPA